MDLHGFEGPVNGGTMKEEQGRSFSAEPQGTEPSGAAVIQEVGQMTGLPQDYLNSEISELLGTAGNTVNNLTLDQLRSVLMNYLETLNEEMTQDQDAH